MMNFRVFVGEEMGGKGWIFIGDEQQKLLLVLKKKIIGLGPRGQYDPLHTPRQVLWIKPVPTCRLACIYALPR